MQILKENNLNNETLIFLL